LCNELICCCFWLFFSVYFIHKIHFFSLSLVSMKVHNKDSRILSFEDSSLITNVSNNHSLENVLELLDSTSSSSPICDTDTEKLSPKDFVPHCHTLVGGSSCFLFTNCKPVVLCRTSTDGVFAWRCFSCFPTLVFFSFLLC